MDYSPQASPVHGILQAGTLEWIVILFSRGSSWPRNQIQVSRTAGRFFTFWATRGAQTYVFVVAHSLGHVHLFATPWTSARHFSLSFTISRSLLKVMSIESVMPSNHLILCCPLLLLPLIFPSIRVFSNKSALHIRWPWYWSFSFSVSPSSTELIPFRIDWFDLHAAQGTLKHHSSKASTLQCSAFFMVQLSHPYMTTGKTVTLTIQILVGKEMSLLFNMLF